MSKKRNRAEGWTFAKLSGHKNENRLAKLINDDSTYKKHLQNRLGLKEEILSCKEGGIFEKNTKDIFGKSTKRKTDLILTCGNNTFVNISLKKSRSGQAYLIGIDRFIEGFQKQFNTKIDKTSDFTNNLLDAMSQEVISFGTKVFEEDKVVLEHVQKGVMEAEHSGYVYENEIRIKWFYQAYHKYIKDGKF